MRLQIRAKRWLQKVKKEGKSGQRKRRRKGCNKKRKMAANWRRDSQQGHKVWWMNVHFSPNLALTQECKNFLNFERWIKMKKNLQPCGFSWWCLDSLKLEISGSCLDFKRRGCTWARTPTWLDEVICTNSTQTLAKRWIRSCMFYQLKCKRAYHITE